MMFLGLLGLLIVLILNEFDPFYFIGMSLMFIGAISNFLCLLANKGLMPAYLKDGLRLKMDDKHIGYQHKKEITFWYLSDIIDLNFIKLRMLVSIGDIFLITGMGFIVTSFIIQSIPLIKDIFYLFNSK
jgi:hypothetical protein